MRSNGKESLTPGAEGSTHIKTASDLSGLKVFVLDR